MQRADLIVIGGGILGLATAWQFLVRHPGAAVVLLEKESGFGHHQTGHNSGVLHTGIYYTPGSHKARNCADGRLGMIAFCRQHEIRHEICGKVIVATSTAELPRLAELERRATANGVECESIDDGRLRELEPHVTGIQGLHVPGAGIVDYGAVVNKLAELITAAGGQLHTSARVCRLNEIDGAVAVATDTGEFHATRAVNCAGLQSDRVTRLSGLTPPARIVPFRGEYYQFKAGAPQLCRNLVYPVPDPAFPFLGVHFTRMIDDTVEAGPNAVLALAREGYKKTDFNLTDLLGTLTYPGFLRLACRYWRTGAGEVWRSLSKQAFVRALQRLIPEVRAEHLEPAPAGVRAQAVAADGSMVDDFLIRESGRCMHVCNAPSPAATASLNIAASLVKGLDNPHSP